MDRYWPPDPYDRSDLTDDLDVTLPPAIVALIVVLWALAFVLFFIWLCGAAAVVPTFSGLGG